MAEEALKSLNAAKTDWRTAKGTLTRCGKSSTKLIDVKRPDEEVRDALHKFQLAFEDLVAKHENYSQLIEDDGQSSKYKRDGWGSGKKISWQWK